MAANDPQNFYPVVAGVVRSLNNLVMVCTALSAIPCTVYFLLELNSSSYATPNVFLLCCGLAITFFLLALPLARLTLNLKHSFNDGTLACLFVHQPLFILAPICISLLVNHGGFGI